MRTDTAVLLSILGAAVLSMGVFALSGASRRHDPHEVADRGSFVLGDFARRWFYWVVHPVLAVSLALGLHPVVYNLLGVAFGILGGVAFATGHVVLGGWGILLGGIADVLDGRVARARGLADERGAFLDSTLDRFAEVGAFVGLGVLYADTAWALAVVVTALGGSLLVSYARARGESVGVVCKLGIMQRAERILAVGLGGVLDPAVSAAWGWPEGTLLLGILALVAAGTVGTAVFRTVWIARRL